MGWCSAAATGTLDAQRAAADGPLVRRREVEGEHLGDVVEIRQPQRERAGPVLERREARTDRAQVLEDSARDLAYRERVDADRVAPGGAEPPADEQRGGREARYYTTSTLISAALPTAALVKHRKSLAGNALPQAEQQIAQLATADVRLTLLHAARARPSPSEAAAQATRILPTNLISRPAAPVAPSAAAGMRTHSHT